ncbi:MAG: CHAD domain-containing protein [Actinomycetota bacterium]
MSPAATDTAAWLRGALGPSLDRLGACNATDRVLDPEAVHAARVATRRLRADLKVLRGPLGGNWDGDVRPELEWIGGLLGAVRDADVLAGALSGEAAIVPEALRAGAARLRRTIGIERDRAQAALLLAVEGARFAALLDHLQRILADPPAASDLDPSIVMKPVWRALKRRVRDLGLEPSDAALHDVRIATKRARYAAEMFGSADRADAARFVRRASRLQEALGRHHDAAVAVVWLLDATSPDPEVALAAGWLAARFAQARDVQRKAWRTHWQKLSRAEARFW